MNFGANDDIVGSGPTVGFGLEDAATPQPPKRSLDENAALFADLNGVGATLQGDDKTRFDGMLANSTEPDEDRARTAVTSYFSERYGKPHAEVSQFFTQYSREFSRKELNEFADLSPSALYGRIGAELKKDVDEREMMKEGLQGLYEAALSGESDYLKAWNAGAESRKQNPGFRPGRADAYRSVAKKAFDDFMPRVIALRPEIEVVSKYLAGYKKFSPDEGTFALRAAAKSALAGLTEDEQREVLGMAGVISSKRNNDVGGLEKTGIRFAESTQGMLRDSASFFTQPLPHHGGFSTSTGKLLSGLQNEQELIANRKSRRLDYLIDLAASGDPALKGDSWITEGLLAATESLPYMAATLSPAGIAVNYTATTERVAQQMQDRGVPAEKAYNLAAISAAPYVAMDFVSAKMAFKGKLPGFEKLLTGPVTTAGGFVARGLGVGALEFAEQYAQEAAQDLTAPAAQSIASFLDETIPEVDWSKEFTNLKDAAPETMAAVLPLVLLGTGVATFKDASFGREYLKRTEFAEALGFSKKLSAEIAEAPTAEAASEIIRANWDGRNVTQTQVQQQAVATLNEEVAAVQESSLTVEKLADGTFAILDADGQPIDSAQTQEAAAELLQDHARAEEATLDQTMSEMRSYVEGFQEPGQSVEMMGKKQTLAGQVSENLINKFDAQKAIKVAVELGKLESGSTLENTGVIGENIASFDLKERIFKDVSRIYEGAAPETIIEEHAEGYLKRRLADGSVTLPQIYKWREAVEGGGGINTSERASIEWFSQQAQAYLLGKQLDPRVPKSFRAYLRKLKEYFTELMEAAANLVKMERDGTLPEDYRQHLAQAVGLDRRYLDNQQAITEPRAPAVFKAVQSGFGVAPDVEMFNATQRIGETPPGSTVSRKSIEDAGFKLPDRTFSLKKTESLSSIVSKWEDSGIKADAYDSDGVITLSRIVVPESERGEGVGTKAMMELIAYADKTGQTIALSPSTDFGASSKERLKKFYKRLGFVENRGANKDFAVSESMLRISPASRTFALASRKQAEAIERAYKERRVTQRIANKEGPASSYPPEVAKLVEEKMYEVRGLRAEHKRVGEIMAKGTAFAEQMLSDPSSDLHLMTRIGLTMALSETYAKEGNYDRSAYFAERAAELGTEAGQGINMFKLLGAMLDSPEKALAYFARQRNNAKKIIRDNREVEAATEEIEKALPDAKTAEELESSVIKRMRARGLATPKQVRDALKKLIELRDEGKLPTAKISDIIASKYEIPDMSTEERAELAAMAERVARLPQNSVYRADAVMDMMNFMHDRLKNLSLFDKGWALWYGNILSGYNTHIRNVVGNAVELGATGFIDTLIRNPAEWYGQVTQALYGSKRGAAAGFAEGYRHFRTGESVVSRSEGDKFSAGGVLERVNFTGGRINPANYVKYVGRLLRAEDSVAFHTAYELKSFQGALEMAQAEGLEGEAAEKRVEQLLNLSDQQQKEFTERAEAEWANLNPGDVKGTKAEFVDRRVLELTKQEREAGLVERATDYANRVTFNYKPEGLLGILAEGIATLTRGAEGPQPGQRKADRTALDTILAFPRLIVPFARVVANVTNRQLDYLIGAPRSILPTTFVLEGGRIKFQDKTSDQRAIELKKGLVGAAGLIAAGIAGMPGDDDEERGWSLHAGGPSNPNARAVLAQTGWKPWSLQIGDTYIPFRYLPIGIGLASVAEMHDHARYKETTDESAVEKVGFGLAAVGAATLDASFLSNLSDFLGAVSQRDGDARAQALNRFVQRTVNAGSLVPFSNLVNNLTTDLDAYDRDRNGAYAFLASQVPVSQLKGEPAIDLFGDAIENRAFEAFVGRSKAEGPEDRLYRLLAEKEAWPTGIRQYQGKMEPEAYYEFQKVRGAILKQIILRNESTLRAAKSGDKAKELVQKWSSTATKQARNVVGYVEPK